MKGKVFKIALGIIFGVCLVAIVFAGIKYVYAANKIGCGTIASSDFIKQVPSGIYTIKEFSRSVYVYDGFTIESGIIDDDSNNNVPKCYSADPKFIVVGGYTLIDSTGKEMPVLKMIISNESKEVDPLP